MPVVDPAQRLQLLAFLGVFVAPVEVHRVESDQDPPVEEPALEKQSPCGNQWSLPPVLLFQLFLLPA